MPITDHIDDIKRIDSIDSAKLDITGDGSQLTGLPSVASAAEIRTGTDDEKFVTSLGINNTVLGIGQSWQNVTASRAIGVTYTNDTGKPIMVNTWTGNVSSTGSLSIFVNGVRVIGNQHPSTAYMMSSGAVIVPNGATYSTEKGSGAVGTLYFMELR